LYKLIFICFLYVSGYTNYDEGVPADKEEAHSSTLSRNSPTRFTKENSAKKIVVHGDVMESALSNKESKHLDEWHDFSQISAGNEKDKLTPLSQIGFRDPASIGGGQQLTILSMEVLHSFLFCSQYMYCLFFIH
jgi:DNA polymerase zeta